MPSGYDAEVAELFRDLRAATALSEMDLAARIGTRPEVVQALEQGALHALPPWAETCRVVNAYGAMLNLDVRPLLRRIYAQIEAGIVELQPKPMPDVPIMPPPDSGDFASGNAGGAAPHARDNPWPPPAQPPQPAWPNPGPAAPPRPRRPNAGPFPQPQNARPQGQGRQHPPQGWPGPHPAQQTVRPNMPVPRPAPGQAPPDRRPPQPRVPQPQPPQPRPQVPPRQAAPSEAEMLRAEFGQAAPHSPEPKTKRRKPALLKWVIGLLIVSVVAAGGWILYLYAPALPDSLTPEIRSTDPDDPRSKKTDRLPDGPQQPPPAPQ